MKRRLDTAKPGPEGSFWVARIITFDGRPVEIGRLLLDDRLNQNSGGFGVRKESNPSVERQ